MAKKVIAFIGNSNLMEEVRVSAAKELSLADYNFIKIPSKDGSEWAKVFLKVFEASPDIIFFEFNKIDAPVIHFLLLLKAHRATKSIPVVGQFADKKALLEAQGMFPYGAVFTFLKETEPLVIFLDAHYMTYDEPVDMPRFALAERLTIHATIRAMGLVSYVTPTYIGLELDLKLTEDMELKINFNFFENFKNDGFRVALIRPQPPLNYYMNTVELETIEASAWDSSSNQDQEVMSEDDLLAKMDFPSWVESIRDEMLKRDINILIVDSREVSFSKFLNYFDFENTFIKFTSHINLNLEIITDFCPDIIIFQIEEVPESEQNGENELLYNNMKLLRHIMSHVATIEDYNPFVIVFNTNSESEAFRKAFYYNNIMAHPRDFDISVAPVLIELYRKNKKSMHSSEKFFFPPLDPRSPAEIPMEIIITGITEHDISFLYDGELPFYSSYKLDFPTPFFLTIVPPLRSLEASRQGTHYMGLINGADEEDKRELRQLVNFLLAANPRELKNISQNNLFLLRKKAGVTKSLEEAAAEENYRLEKEKAAKKARDLEKMGSHKEASPMANRSGPETRTKKKRLQGPSKL